MTLKSLDETVKVKADRGTARTLLRQPTAPLPTFSGKEGEDFNRFINEFDQS